MKFWNRTVDLLFAARLLQVHFTLMQPTRIAFKDFMTEQNSNAWNCQKEKQDTSILLAGMAARFCRAVFKSLLLFITGSL
jgi:hypothetical protein